MNKFTQYLPACVSGLEPYTIEFETIDELLENELVSRFISGDPSLYFEISENCLYSVSGDGIVIQQVKYLLGRFESPVTITKDDRNRCPRLIAKSSNIRFDTLDNLIEQYNFYTKGFISKTNEISTQFQNIRNMLNPDLLEPTNENLVENVYQAFESLPNCVIRTLLGKVVFRIESLEKQNSQLIAEVERLNKLSQIQSLEVFEGGIQA